MHLEQLKYFAEIIKCGSINKAAHNLFLSPSALSVSLTNLEKELGFKLVERSGRGVKPTELGEAISKEVNEILQMIDDYYVQWQNLNSHSVNLQSSISIGISPLIDTLPFSNALTNLKKYYPQLNCQVIELPTKDIIRSLDEKILNLAIIARFKNADSKNKSHFVLDSFLNAKKNWRKTILKTFSLKILLPHTHPLAQMDSLTFNDLSPFMLIYPDKESHLFDQISDNLPKVRLSVNSTLVCLNMLTNSLYENSFAFFNHLSIAELTAKSLNEPLPEIVQELLMPGNVDNSACEIIQDFILQAYRN